MKKILLLGIVAAGSIGFANGQASYTNYGTKIGETYYDLQSNYSSGNRIIRHPDGKVSAVWTEDCTPDPGSCDPAVGGGGCVYANRGAGYNFFDGTAWVHGDNGTCDETGSEFGIFPGRVGWPEIIALPSGKEMVFAHTPLQYVARPQYGQGGMAAWQHSGNLFTPATFTDTWPRVASSGTTIHMIATCQPCTTRGVIGPIRYFRSQDEGATWDKVDVELPGLDRPFFSNIGADNYAIHANGQNVAILAGGGGDDWAMWKSTDNGTTFTKITISSYDVSDTLELGLTYPVYETVDAFQSVIVDKNGVAHAFAGHSVIAIDRDSLRPNDRYYPGLGNGIMYWNETMTGQDPIMAVNGYEDIYPASHPLDFIADGTENDDFAPFAAGLVNMPTAAIDVNNNLYLVYSAVIEGTSNNGDTTGQAFRDIYVTRSQDGGATWSTPHSIPFELTGQRSEFEDNVFPSVAKEIGPDNILHILWQNDDESGLHIRIDYDGEALNRIMYTGLDLNQVYLSAPEEITYAHNISVAPNPTRDGMATVNLTLDRPAKVGVKVTNILGQEVYNVPAAEKATGPSEIKLDLSAQPAGIYIYSVIVDGVAKTQRLVKE